MESNRFELTGKINYIETKYKDNGKCFTKILMAKKAKDDDYQAFNIVFFDELAEETGEMIKKGDVINVTGKLSVTKYIKDDKEIQCVNLIGFKYNFAKYDKDKKEYVEALDIEENTEIKNNAKDDEIPW